MTKDNAELPSGVSDLAGRFGFQPIEERGHQPLIATTREETALGGYQPTTSQAGSTPPKPPSQGSSSKK